MYKYINEDTNSYMGNKRCYVPDELEKINNIIDGVDLENEWANEENEDVDNAQFEIINRTIHNQKAINNSTNYRIMTTYLSKLKKTYNGKKLISKERNNIVESLLNDDTHFIELTEKLFETRSSDKDYLVPRLIEFPLECMGSYIQCTQNSNAYLRRKYFDGQIRKRKDGSTYQRKYNISTESDLVKIGEDGEEFSLYQNVKTYDKYFDDISDLLSVLNDNEREVAICLNNLSTYNKRATIKEIVEYTNFTKRQVETLIINIRIKMLKYLSDNGMCDEHKRYYELCKHNKDFNKKYANCTK